MGETAKPLFILWLFTVTRSLGRRRFVNTDVVGDEQYAKGMIVSHIGALYSPSVLSGLLELVATQVE